MFDQVTFTGPYEDAYLLMRDPSLETPWPSRAHYERVKPDVAARVVRESLCDSYGNPSWALLDLLEIRDHPRNIQPRDLEALAMSLVGDGAARRFLLYRRLDELAAPQSRQPRARESLPGPEPGAPLDFFGLELVDDDDRPVPSVRLELTLPDGSHRVLVTNERGAFLVDRIAAGTCVVVPPSEPSARTRE